MARTRAIDYAAKEESILRTAARLFSQEGVERTSMAMVAAECGYSKALLYHYYDSKESILFDIVSRHLELLIVVVTKATDELEWSSHQSQRKCAELKLGAMVAALLETYGENEDQHRIQLAGLASLSAEHLTEINSLERILVDRFANVIAQLMPDETSKEHLLKPVTMSLFGMLNWHYMWFREHGPMTRQAYAELATNLIVYGAKGVKSDLIAADTKATKKRNAQGEQK